VLRRDEIQSDPIAPVFRMLCALIYILPWFSQIVAREAGYQPYTLGLMLLVFFQYKLLQGSSDNTKVPCVT
jgi:hypothetical protein